MKNLLLSLSAVLVLFFGALQPTKAQTPIDVSIGTAGGNFTVGTNVSTTAFNNKVGPSGLNQPAPFSVLCGSDIAGNCSASWTFNYTVPSGDSITSATLSLGILDIDSAASGDQVATFTLDGSDDLTGLLNAASEGLNGGTGAPNNQYYILTITIPGSDLAALTSGSATFALALQGPGLGTLGTTMYNGAGLDFSTLDMEAMGPTPEPSSWMLFATAMLCFGIKRILTKSA